MRSCLNFEVLLMSRFLKKKINLILDKCTHNRHRCPKIRNLSPEGLIFVREFGKLATCLRYMWSLNYFFILNNFRVQLQGWSDCLTKT